jgi:hypothetical protein
MGTRNLRTLGLASCLMISAAPWCLGQLSSSLSQNPSMPAVPTLPSFSSSSTPGSGGTGGDAVGSTVNSGFMSLGLSSESEQVNGSEVQAADSGKRSSNALIAGRSLFGASSTAVIAGKTQMSGTDSAVFGSSPSYTSAGEKTSLLEASSSSGSSHGGTKGLDVASSGAGISSRSVQTAALKGNSAYAGASKMRAGKSGTSSGFAFATSETNAGVSPGGAAAGAASYPEAFPDSTLARAVLSPPASPRSPFPGPPDGLEFALPDLSDAHFLKLTLRKTGGGRGSGRNPEDAYQRLRNRLNSSQSSTSPSHGLSTGLSPSSYSSFGSHSGYGSGLKSSTGLGLSTGLQSTNPYLRHP